MPRRPYDNIKTIIYILKHPTTNEVRYVGKTCRTLQRRLSQHICFARTKREHVYNWINSVITTTGLRPIIEALETVEGNGAAEEIKWIAEYKQRGARLCNHSEGGEHSAAGVKRSIEYVEKLKARYADETDRARHTLITRHIEPTVERIEKLKTEWEKREVEAWLKPFMKKVIKSYVVDVKASEKATIDTNNIIVPLTHNGSAFLPVGKGMYAEIDADDWEKVKGYRWYTNSNGDGSVRVRTTVLVNGLSTKLNINQLIYGKGIRRKPGKGLDYRKANAFIHVRVGSPQPKHGVAQWEQSVYSQN